MAQYATIRDPSDPQKRKKVKLTEGRYLQGTPSNWSNWELEKEPPDIVRDESGDIMQRGTGLDRFKKHSDFLNAAKEVVRKKQNYNQKLQKQKDYWRTLMRDTSPFGGKRDEALQMPGTFTDEEFRQMSPQAQASVRASRMGAAQAHLQGLAEEERYRSDKMQDIANLVSQYSTEGKTQKDLLDEQYKQLQITKARRDLGYEPSASDLGLDPSRGIGKKIGGSVSWRHNNPGAIKYKPWMAEKYGATKGQAATDSGHFAIFPNTEIGRQAIRDLLANENYRNLTIDQALNRWSNDGYGAEITDIGENTRMSTLIQHPELLERLIDNMKEIEGWDYNKETRKILDEEEEEDEPVIEMTNAKKTKLAQDAGFSTEDVKDFTTDNWLALEKIIRDVYFSEANKFIQQSIPKIESEKMDESQLEAALIRNYGEILSQKDIDSVLMANHFDKKNALFGDWRYMPPEKTEENK